MFGYILANMQTLQEADKVRYRQAYCSLCHSLGSRYGLLSRLSLNYDITFLILFLSAVRPVREEEEMSRCIASPLEKKRFFSSEIADYAADMNIALTYYNLMDDWNDDHNPISWGEAMLFKKGWEKVSGEYPRQCGIMRKSLEELARMEEEGEPNPDLPAACFGRLMAELFVRQEDDLSFRLRRFGFSLGKFIYILDACMDLKKDLKKERYNPMIAVSGKDFDDILHALMGEVIFAYGLMDLQKDKSLIDHILFSGVFTKYEVFRRRREQGR